MGDVLGFIGEGRDGLGTGTVHTANVRIDGVLKLEGSQMPRIARIKVRGEETVHHVMSRTALDGLRLYCRLVKTRDGGCGEGLPVEVDEAPQRALLF